ncbi:unnamed protein product [Moneuplotes crassus]|uniref:Polycystin cation channel PKD1/PKD2 domain-containing protein n=1 Tax=Euplotes crassus TaxID=5936 RepID=A0AAD1XWR9_EUPCR|nr:unnamed protein product [Moneuplotes crassus]
MDEIEEIQELSKESESPKRPTLGPIMTKNPTSPLEKVISFKRHHHEESKEMFQAYRDLIIERREDNSAPSSISESHSSEDSGSIEEEKHPMVTEPKRPCKPNLMDCEFMEIKNVFSTCSDKRKKNDEEDTPDSLNVKPTDLNTSVFRIIIHICFLVIYIISCSSSQKIGSANSMARTVTDIFESRPYNKNGDTYEKITEKEDLYQFFGNVIIAQIYDESQKEFEAMAEGYHYLSYSNYFCGLRLTHNRALAQTNTDAYKEKIPVTRKGNYKGKSNQRQSNLHTEPFGTDNTKYSKNGGYKGKGGYVHYFDDSLDYYEALIQYATLLEDGVFEGDLVNLVVEIMLYNENFQVGINLAYEFMINNAGKIETYKDIQAFYVSRYSKDYHQSSKFLQYFFMSLDIIFFLGLLFYSYEIGKVIIRVVKELFRLGEINVFWYEVIDLIIILLSHITIVFWGLIVINPRDIKLPVDQDQFQDYAELGGITSIFKYIICINIILICIRSLKLLTVKFPSFSALFDTVRIAFNDFIIWFLVITILLCGFVYMSMFLVGTYDPESDNFLNVYIRMLNLTFGFTSISIEENGDNNLSTLARFMSLVFVIVFILLLSKMLMTIVIIRYIYLRSCTQLYNEAIARITYKDSNLLYVFFPKKIEKPKDSEEKDEVFDERNAGFTIRERICYRIQRILRPKEIKSKDEIDKEIIDIIQQIKKEKEDKRKKRLERVGLRSIGRMKNRLYSLLLHSIFSIIFIFVSLYHIDNTSSFEHHNVKEYIKSQEFVLASDLFGGGIFGRRVLKENFGKKFKRSITGPPVSGSDPSDEKPSEETPDDVPEEDYPEEDYPEEDYPEEEYPEEDYPEGDTPTNSTDPGNELLRNIYLSFDDISETKMIEDWMYDILFTTIFDDDYKIKDQNFVIGIPVIFLAVRRTKEHQNKDSDTNKIFPNYISYEEHSIYTKLGDEAYKEDINLRNGEVVKYNPEGRDGTVKDAGGYRFPIPRDKDQAYSIDVFGEDELIAPSWVNIAFAFFYVNRNNHNFVINFIQFDRLPSGEIRSGYDIGATRFRYKSHLDRFILFLEIVWLCILSFYWYILIKTIFLIFKKYVDKSIEKQPPHMRRAFYLLRVMRIDCREIHGYKTCQGLWYIMKKLTICLLKLSFYIVKAILKYSFSSIYNIVHFISLILILVLIRIWIRIATQSEFKIQSDGNAPGCFDYISDTVYLLSDYRIYTSILSILLFFRLTKLFDLSQKLAIFTDIITESATDLMFFILMFTVFLCGYSLIAHFQFGISNEEYREVAHTVLALVRLASGSGNLDNQNVYSSFDKDMFRISFIMIMILLLNMMASIIISHYVEQYIASMSIYTGEEESKNNLWKKITHKFNSYCCKCFKDAQEEEENPKRSKPNVTNLKIKERFFKNNSLKMYTHINDKSVELENNLEAQMELNFWVTNLTSKVSQLLYKNYTNQLVNNEHDVLDYVEHPPCSCGKLHDQDCPEVRFDETQIVFLMRREGKQIKIWEKSEISKKFKLWKAAQINYDQTEGSNDSYVDKFSDSMDNSNSREQVPDSHERFKSNAPLQNQFDSHAHESEEDFSGGELSLNIIEQHTHFDEEKKPHGMISDIQKQLWWHHTDNHERIRIFKKLSFTMKVQLWNSIGFSREHFKKAGILADNEEFDYFKCVQRLDFKQINKLAVTIIEESNLTKGEYFTSLNKGIWKNNKRGCKLDARACIWFEIPLYLKFQLYINTNSKNDAKVLAIMLYSQFKFLKEIISSDLKKGQKVGGKQIKYIIKFDAPLESTLKNLIYKKYYMNLCELKANICSFKFMNLQMDKIYNEDSQILNYIRVLYQRIADIYQNKKKDCRPKVIKGKVLKLSKKQELLDERALKFSETKLFRKITEISKRAEDLR